MHSNGLLSEMQEMHLKFIYLDKYVSFLFGNHIYMKNLVDYSFSKAKEARLPLMNLLQDKTEEEKYLLWKESFINNFLIFLTQENPLTGLIERIDKWKANQILVPREKLLIEDILSLSYIRKLALFEFIPFYTQEITIALEIIKELEAYFKLVEQYAFKAYDEMNRTRLEEKEKVLNGLLSNLPIVVTRMDTSGNIKDSMGAGLQELNIENGYLKGKNMFDIYPDARNVERVVKEQIFLSFEGTAGTEGNIRHFENYFFPEGNEIVGFSIDITERKKTEEKLKETQHYISQIAHTSPDTLYIYNLAENRIVYVNRDTSESLGYSTEEIYDLGADIVPALFHPEDIAKIKSHFREFNTAKDKEVRETQFRIRNKEWNWRHILTRETVFKRTSEGTPYEIIGILRDITEQKEAEEEIRYKTRLLDKLLYNFPISISRIDTNGTFLESRGQGIRKFGSYDNQIIGWNVYEKFPSLIEPVKKILSGETIEFIGYTDYKGRTIYYKNYGFFDQEKECAIILAIEITELKEAKERLKNLNDELELKVLERTKELAASEEELRQALANAIELNNKIAASENFLSSIIDQSPISTWISDANGTLIRINEACLKLFGVEHAEACIGKYNLFKDTLLKQSPFFKNIKAVFTEGKIAKFSGDYNLSKVSHVDIPTGVPVSVITTLFPIKNENGQVINAVVQHEDVSQRKKALKALQKSEEQLRLITDSLPVLITYIDTEERYRFNNKTYEEWFNIPRAKVYGLKVREVIGEPAYEKIKDYIHMALRGQEISFEIELPYLFGLKYVSIDYIPRYEGEEVAGFYALVTDISERKESEKAIEKALQETEVKNQELTKINQLLDNFVYMAAHDLKSPVSNIKVLISLLNKETDSEKKPDLLAAVQESINRLDNTIEGLVEVIEIQSVNNIPTKTISFQHILNLIMADAASDLEKCNGHIFTDFSQCPTVSYIEPFLLSIIRNLITNAIKYHSPSRNLEIRIISAREKEFVLLTIADNGMGMDLSRYGQHLFKPFTRFTTKAKGKGLGLHLVKTMIEKNGGMVQVESSIDAGTTFRIFLREY